MTSTDITPRSGRELSAKELEARAKKAHATHKRLLAALQRGRVALWDMAQECMILADTQGFRDLGYDSLNEYLGDSEVGISRSHFMRLVRVARFAQQRQLVEQVKDVEITKLDVVIPAIRDGKALADEALSDAKTLSKRDLIEKYIGEPDNDGEPASNEGEGSSGQVDVSTPVTAGDIAQGVDDGLSDDRPDENDARAPQDDVSRPLTGEVVGEDGSPVEDGRTPQEPSEPEDVPHPTVEDWEFIVGRAKTRRQNLVRYIEKHTEWERVQSAGDLAVRTAWVDPAVAAERAQAETPPPVVEVDREAQARAQAQARWDWFDHVEKAKGLHALLMDAIASEATMPRINARAVADCMDSLQALIERTEASYDPLGNNS